MDPKPRRSGLPGVLAEQGIRTPGLRRVRCRCRDTGPGSRSTSTARASRGGFGIRGVCPAGSARARGVSIRRLARDEPAALLRARHSARRAPGNEHGLPLLRPDLRPRQRPASPPQPGPGHPHRQLGTARPRLREHRCRNGSDDRDRADVRGARHHSRRHRGPVPPGFADHWFVLRHVRRHPRGETSCPSW